MLNGHILAHIPTFEFNLIPCPHGEGDVLAVAFSRSPLCFTQVCTGAGRGRWWRVIGVQHDQSSAEERYESGADS